MTRDESMLYKRLLDLSDQAFRKGIPTFSDFLNLNEQNIFHSCIPELSTGFRAWGGYEYAERQMIAFLPEALLFDWAYPIALCRIEPLNHRFADPLSHRDVLGALMSLGIERSKIGDILVKDNRIYVFCQEKISGFLLDALTRIRHTTVRASLAELADPDIRPKLQQEETTVTSNRLDALLASMCHLSRGQAVELIQKGLVFINGRQMTSSSAGVKPEEIISVRGTGRFRFEAELGETKKGRLRIRYSRYV